MRQRAVGAPVGAGDALRLACGQHRRARLAARRFLHVAQHGIDLGQHLENARGIALAVGAGLGGAGAAMQGYLRNPLADPGLFGIAPGAALGAGEAPAAVAREVAAYFDGDREALTRVD